MCVWSTSPSRELQMYIEKKYSSNLHTVFVYSHQTCLFRRVCIDHIEDVVEEEEDELTQSARLSSNAAASTSQAQVLPVPAILLPLLMQFAHSNFWNMQKQSHLLHCLRQSPKPKQGALFDQRPFWVWGGGGGMLPSCLTYLCGALCFCTTGVIAVCLAHLEALCLRIGMQTYSHVQNAVTWRMPFVLAFLAAHRSCHCHVAQTHAQ